MKKYFIAIGSNWPNLTQNSESILKQVVQRFENRFPLDFISSEILKSAPLGPQNQPWFFNMVVSFQSSWPAMEMLAYIKGLETIFGRQLRRRWGERELDLDIVAISDEIHQLGRLKIPHPQMNFRSFVLNPLRECDPNWKHPLSAKSIHQLILELGENEAS